MTKYLFIILLVIGCGEESYKFDEDEAFNYLIKQCEFGPRNPGSEGYFKCRDFMIAELKKSTDQIILQDFTHPAHTDLKFQNIIARFNPNAKFQTIISCHWDTRPIADHDSNPNNHNKPIIGAINGTAAGVGAAFALACDLRVMSEKSAILYAFINIGLGPDGGASWLLSRQVGYSKAFEIAISGKKVLGQQCFDLGLTNRIVENELILENAINWAKELANRPTLAIGITKQDLVHSMNNDLYSTIAYEAERQVLAFKSHDLKEGVTAFIEKRKPNFKGN